MKTNPALRLLSIAGIGLVMTQTAWSQEDSYYYGGLSVGQSHSALNEQATSNSLLGAYATSSMAHEQQDTAYRLFGGYQLNRNIAIEGGYFNLGKFTYSANAPSGTLNGKYEVEGIHLDLVGTAPLTDKFALLGRLGIQYANTRDAFNGTAVGGGINASPNERETNLKVGVGMQYAFTPNVLLRGEAERYRLKDGVGNHGDVNVFSMSLVFPFGRQARERVATVSPAYVAPAPAPSPAPAPMPMEPAPAPVALAPVAPMPPPAPVLPKRMQFSADSLFGFDQSGIRPDGRAALDTFSQELKGSSYSQVRVEGNTDRLGSSDYNQKLSQRRADAVKQYLVTTSGLDAAKVSAIGRGETNPVTKPEDCKGNKTTPALITCLQPDRRVDVEVEAQR
jgi:OOP family OmpA-OmpF porin